MKSIYEELGSGSRSYTQYDWTRSDNPVVSQATVSTPSAFHTLNVYEQYLGPRNSPVVNRLEYNRIRATYFNGSYGIFWGPKGSQRLSERWEGNNVFANCTPYPSSYIGDGSAERRALSSLYSKLRNMKANLAVDVAESGQTVRLVQGAVDRVLSFARRLRRSPASTMADTWLEYQYGWKPALQTIYDVANFSRNNLLSVLVDASSIERLSVSDQYLHSGVYPVNRSVNHTNVCRFSCRLNIKNNTLYDVQRLTSLNPLSIAWELVPYSFVVDWFVDIGGYLEDLETAVSMGYMVSSLSKSFRGRWTETHQMAVDDWGWFISNGNVYGNRVINSTALLDRTYKVRIPLGALPVPYAPRFDAHLGASHLTSGAALLQQIFRR